MKRTLGALLALALCLLPLFAAPGEGLALSAPIEGEGLALSAPIEGERTYPEGAAETTYRLSYAYPQFEETDEAVKAINAFYRSLSEDVTLAGGDEQPSTGDAGAPTYTELGYRVTRNDGLYLSVVLTSRAMLGNAESETLSADTFARDGLYAGQPLSLTQVLGLEREDDALEGGQSLAEGIVYRLVWQIISAASENTDAGYPEGVTEDNLYAAFSPETDFYLDADGNIVFFIQSGEIAGEIAGVLYFPFAPMELLSAAGE